MKRKDHDDDAYEEWLLTQSHKKMICDLFQDLEIRIDPLRKTIPKLFAQNIIDNYLGAVLRIMQKKNVRTQTHHGRLIGVHSANLKKWWARETNGDVEEEEGDPRLDTFLFTLAALNLPASEETFPSGFEISLKAWECCLNASATLLSDKRRAQAQTKANVFDVICVLLCFRTKSLNSYFQNRNVEDLRVCAIDVHDIFCDVFQEVYLPEEVRKPTLDQVETSLRRWFVIGMGAYFATKTDLFHYGPELTDGD